MFSRKAAQQITASAEKKVSNVVNLLDMKRSMNMNIWLKQFRTSNEAIIEMIEKADQKKSEKLKGLIKLLPDRAEIDLLTNFDGDQSTLGNAEKIIKQLSQLNDYALRLNLMLIKLEYRITYNSIHERQEAFLTMCHNILECESLKKFFRVVLQYENFLNVGSYAGNALAFKISSLPKLSDTQGNQREIALLHFLVLQCFGFCRQSLRELALFFKVIDRWIEF
ncbi:hypothetical protein HELRODRAFT_176187 [Helobdella robusta]|uniref:FH2 domain-containing protein n=1 Tax=Helobdella robusta TaxID=6412 RepID=T1FA98_HELRO|nr:hypothetical protein HELRODRAFT_176187 [Helobdella robusta]ESO00318.1 hypothetical protein HELRODRAFT_176187 [Helobdella robusta]